MPKTNYMQIAYEQAQLAGHRGEVPVGAIIVQNQTIIAAEGNRTLELSDPTAHAEILAIKQACKTLNNERLLDCDLYVTLEPCPMCASAISFARIRRLYFGAFDNKSGAVESGPRLYTHSACHHKPEVYSGIMESQNKELLQAFFKQMRIKVNIQP